MSDSKFNGQEAPNNVLDSLQVGPQSSRNGNLHQRSGSGYSNNYSLLDMYDGDSEDDYDGTQGLQGPQDPSLPRKPNHNRPINSQNPPIDTVTTKPLDNNLDLDLNDKTPENTKDSNVNKELLADLKRQLYVKHLTPKNVQEILKGDYDRYGFKKISLHKSITKEQYNDWFKEYSQYAISRKKKWNILMKNNGLQVNSEKDIPSRFPPKSDKVKKMIRRGIPGEWRGSAWFFYAGGYEKLNKHVGIYDKIVRDTRDIQNKDTEVIERDLNRTFPDNYYFNKSSMNANSNSDLETPNNPIDTPMIKSLRRVLVAFAHYQPQIGYCQSLNFLAGLLLLFMTEERAFWMLVILTERIIPKVHSQDLEGVHTDQGVLMLCIKEYIPLLWSILGKTFEGEILSEDKILTKLPPVTLVTSSWFMSVFVGILPIESVLRIWDILWYEGSKTIFRFSLTICKTCLDSEEFQTTNPKNKNSELEQIEVFQFLQKYPKTLIDPNMIIDNCFKKIGGYGFGSLSQDEINKCREFVSKQRQKLKYKKNSVPAPEMNEQERNLLANQDDDIHDVYGFNRSIMSGVAWNNNISNKMKKRFSRKSSKPSLT